MERSFAKRKCRRGITRFTVILIVLVVVMLIVAAIPIYIHLRDDSARTGCLVALDSARRQLAVDYLMVNGTPTAKDAKDVVTYAMNGWDDLCPGGGTVYVIETKREDWMPYDVVCGLHGEDRKQCTRLNASYVLQQIEEAVKREQALGNRYPEAVTVQLHHEDVTAVLVDDYTGIRRGTATTAGVDGIVAFYSLVGHSDFGENSGLKQGELWYFSYADEEYCAAWSSTRSWTGDSYE